MPLVCLDVDGCLVDSRAMILGSFQRALASLELAPIEPADLLRFVGPPLHDTARVILRERQASHIDPDVLIDAYREDFRATCLETVASYPGMPEAVGELAERHTLAVVTSKPIPLARPLLDALDLSRFFVAMEGPDLAENEPKTITLGRALDGLGQLTADGVVMVGDRHHDVEAGHANGTLAVGVTWGFGSRDEHVAAGAHAIVDDPSELVDAIADVLERNRTVASDV